MSLSAPRAVGDILPQAVPQLADRLVEFAIRRRWRSLVGPLLGSEAARRIQPGALSGERLHVVVDNSPWLQEVTLRGPDIVAALTREFGPGTVRSLKVTLGPIDADPTPPVRRQAEPGQRVTDDERRAVDLLLAPITDPDLARSMRRLLLKTGRFS